MKDMVIGAGLTEKAGHLCKTVKKVTGKPHGYLEDECSRQRLRTAVDIFTGL